jgi:hypothetical protein
MPILTITLGRLWAKPIRDYLRRAKFACSDVEWIETGGLITRVFTVRAPQAVIDQILSDYKRWETKTSDRQNWMS